MDIIKKINSVMFIFKIAFLFFTETLLYGLTHDYHLLIERLTDRLSGINILYVKIFQAFAFNNSLIDDTTNNYLLKFTDNVPWNFSDIDLKQLTDMAAKYNIVLKQGYEVPINAGMISLVFIGYKENKKIIIKMKRKNIQQRLNDDINNLLFLTYLLSFIPFFYKYQFDKIVHKNVDIIKHQTDFLEEIENMNRIRENCKHLKYIKIPIAYKEITEEYSDIIVMEYINGLKINQLEPADYEPFSKLVVKFGIVTMVIHGLTHGDLHGGNILFIKDKLDTEYPHKLGIIDFGIIYEINAHYKCMMFNIFTRLFEQSPEETAKQILNSALVEPHNVLHIISSKNATDIIQVVANIIEETLYSSKKANQIQIYKLISQLNDYFTRKEMTNLGIRLSDDFVKSQLILAMSHGITLTLCKDDFIPLMDKVLNELFHTQMLL